MKTPGEIAEEYRDSLMQTGERVNAFDAFMAGYQAAMGQLQPQPFHKGADVYIIDANNPLPKPMPLSIAEQDQVADASKVMNSSKKLDGWISVKDRLPAVDTRVLVYEDGVTIVNAISSLNHRWDLYDNGENCRPTHWMPLPEPPEGE